MVELLVAVAAVCRIQSRVAALSHVTHKIDTFIWSGVSEWTLERASEHGLIRLLNCLVKREWPAFNRACRDLRLFRAAKTVVESGYDVRVLEWWLTRYKPDQECFSMALAFALAIEHGRLPVLQWIYHETKGDLTHLEQPVDCSDPDVVVWLHEHGGRHSNARLSLRTSTPNFSFQVLQNCLMYEDGDSSSFKIRHVEYAVTKTIERCQLEHLKRLHEYRPQLFQGRSALDCAVRNGQLEMAKWLQEEFPKHYFEDLHRTFTEFLFKSPYKYDLTMAQWVACEFDWADESVRIDWLDEAMAFAAKSGKLEMLELIYNCTIASYEAHASRLSPVVMDAAAKNGHLAIVQWLHDHQMLKCTAKAMDGAAENGHLDVVQWLHENRSEGCTTYAMDDAALRGHLHVVQWLHVNRSEGCTTRAMDEAARRGHLPIIEWLHLNRSEGCTTLAMDAASGSGHLNIVQWLHDNRTEGCTSDAMDRACANGNLDVVRFLHANRQEGCTPNGKIRAAVNGHFSMFKWLQENRSDVVDLDTIPELGWGSDVISRRIYKCMALYTQHTRLGWLVDKLIEHGDFETAELLLVQARTNGADCGLYVDSLS